MAHFPLAGLLRLRGIELDTAQGRLAGANRRSIENREHRARVMAGLGGSESRPSDALTLMAVAAARSSARADLEALDALIASDDQELAAAQDAFREAKKRTVPLEKMAERHRQESIAAELKSEQDALDETASQRAASR